MNPPPVICVDGQLLPATATCVSAWDRAFRSGEGVFTTFLADAGRVVDLPGHLQRVVDDARILDRSVALEPLQAAVSATVRANRHLADQLVLRVTVSAGALVAASTFPGEPTPAARVVVTAQPAPAARGPATAVTTELHRSLAGTKHTSYLVALTAQRAAADRGVSDGVFTDGAGTLLEAATANLFLVVDGELRCPPPDGSVLPGITAAVVRRLAGERGIAVRAAHLSRQELLRAQEAFLTSSVAGIRPLVRLDDHQLPVGPVTTGLREAYAAVQHAAPSLLR